MEIYPIIVFFIILFFIIFLIFVALYINRVRTLQIPSTTESTILFWITIVFLVIMVILMVYSIIYGLRSRTVIVPENIFTSSRTTVNDVDELPIPNETKVIMIEKQQPERIVTKTITTNVSQKPVNAPRYLTTGSTFDQ